MRRRTSIHKDIPMTTASRFYENYQLPSRKRAHGTAAVFTMGLMLSLCLSARSVADDGVRRAFLHDYGPEAGAIQDFYSNLRLKSRTLHEAIRGTRLVDELDIKIKGLKFCAVGSFHSIDAGTGKPVSSKAGRYAAARNDWYRFDLSGKDTGYTLGGVDVTSGGTNMLCEEVEVFADPQKQQTFLQMGKDPATNFLEWTPCSWDGKEMKRLKVRHQVVAVGARKKIGVTAFYYFSPPEQWVCRRQQVFFDGHPECFEKRLYYDATRMGEVPMLKRREDWLSRTGDPDNAKQRSVTEITEFQHCDPWPDKDFTLTAFGLPEPIGVPSEAGASRAYLWLFGGGAVALLCAIVAGYLRRRRRAGETGAAGAPARGTAQ